MLGTDLSEVFGAKLGSNVVALDRKALDVTNLSQIQSVLKEIKPAVLINAAAYTNVDGAEKDRELAFAVNAEAPKSLAHVCREYHTMLVHFSSDYVFDGVHSTPWKEEDPTDPPKPGYYAETKLKGEEAVLHYPRSLVLRVQWLYGQKKDRFSPLKDKKTFTPITDQVGAPTWTREVAEKLFQLVESNALGLFHFSYDDSASWFQVFDFVKQIWGLDVELLPKKAAELGLPAKRPLYCVLSNKKLCRALNVPGLGSWKAPLKKFLEERA